MRFNKKIIILILAFFIGIIIFFTFRIWQVKKAAKVIFTPYKSSFELAPPKEALKGKLVTIKGEVKKESRDDDEFKEVEEDEEVLSGEKLATGEKSEAEVAFENFVKMSLGPDTEVSFVSLIPASFLIRQSRGTVTYEILKKKATISIRSLSVLFQQTDGLSQITTDTKKGEISIEQLKDRGKIAMVDKENKTQVWEIEEGQEAVIDNEERRVVIDSNLW